MQSFEEIPFKMVQSCCVTVGSTHYFTLNKSSIWTIMAKIAYYKQTIVFHLVNNL